MIPDYKKKGSRNKFICRIAELKVELLKAQGQEMPNSATSLLHEEIQLGIVDRGHDINANSTDLGRLLCVNSDALEPMTLPKDTIHIFKDGDQYCAVRTGFLNLQESLAGFGETHTRAAHNLMYKEEDMVLSAGSKEEMKFLPDE
jgi:hypothetical protein